MDAVECIDIVMCPLVARALILRVHGRQRVPLQETRQEGQSVGHEQWCFCRKPHLGITCVVAMHAHVLMSGCPRCSWMRQRADSAYPVALLNGEPANP
jgi:hypothetical protein